MRDRKSSSPGPAFRGIAAVVLCVQLLPAGISVTAELAHGLYHFSDTLSLDYLLNAHPHSHEGANSHEWAHAHAGARTRAHDPGVHDHVHVGERAHAAGPGTHEHGVVGHRASSPAVSDDAARSTHEHSRAVDALLEVAGDDGVSDIGTPTTPDRGLDLHLPSVPALLASIIARPGNVAADPATSRLLPTLRPDLPPPRA